MGKLFFLVLTFCISNDLWAAPDVYQVGRQDGSSITLYVSPPPGVATYGVTLMVQGSGCASAFQNAVAMGAIVFPDGTATARLDVEKYGIQKDATTCPAAFLEHNTVTERIQDHLIVLNWLRRQSWWNHKLFIVGGSEGGIESASLAVLIPETVKAGLMSSPLGSTMAKSWLNVNEHQLQKEGKTPHEIRNALQRIQKQFQIMRENPTWKKSWQGLTNTYKWWADILDYQTAQLLLQTDVPIIFFQGDNDQESDVNCARELVTKFSASGKNNLTYIERPGEDHTFTDGQGKSHLLEVFQNILTFFGK